MRAGLRRRIAEITALMRADAREIGPDTNVGRIFGDARSAVRAGGPARRAFVERFVNGGRSGFERNFATVADTKAPPVDTKLLTEQRVRGRRLATSVESTLIRRTRKRIARLKREGNLTRRAVRDAITLERRIATRRATLIATDQQAANRAEHTRQATRKLKLPRYVWRTQLDERVRPEHQGLEGVVRRWRDSPRPGEPINCRCFAEPVIG